MYKLCVFITESHIEVVKEALFAVGAGKIGAYDCCSWQTLGSGQFRPLAHSTPYIGERESLETVVEYKLELVVADDLIKPAVAALRKAHPYEEPAFDVWPLTEF